MYSRAFRKALRHQSTRMVNGGFPKGAKLWFRNGAHAMGLVPQQSKIYEHDDSIDFFAANFRRIKANASTCDLSMTAS
jgi:hypothetical protein